VHRRAEHPAEAACARAFAHVLRDALLARAADSDFLLPRTTLGDVLPRPAVAWLRARGADLRFRTACRALSFDAGARVGADGSPRGRWRARTDAGDVDADRVVLAVPPWQVPKLLGAALDHAFASRLASFEPEPIATGVARLGRDAGAARCGDARGTRGRRRARTVAVRTGRAGEPRHGRGDRSERGRPSRRRPARARGRHRAQVATQLRVPVAPHARAIVDKRATIRCSPGRPRFDVDALAPFAPGVALAGDWCWHRYPATLESAVRSGDAAARWIAGAAVLRP
jgi:hypothetical protein